MPQLVNKNVIPSVLISGKKLEAHFASDGAISCRVDVSVTINGQPRVVEVKVPMTTDLQLLLDSAMGVCINKICDHKEGRDEGGV